MIQRYSRPEMSEIWSEKEKYRRWLDVEMAVTKRLAAQGIVPRKDWKELSIRIAAFQKKGGIDPALVEKNEAVTRHDVIAFTTVIADEVGPVSRYIHFGLTSSDVVDTAMSLAIQEAGSLILKDVDQIIARLSQLARKYKKLGTIGRTHGIFAEPTSFGLRFLSWYLEWIRNRERLSSALERMRTGKLSGAVGVNAHWSPEFEEKALKDLNLKREAVSTQILPRDHHAELLSVMAICGASLERIALELRHLQRSEVRELREGFSIGQKGSSAMPHKRNPISSENLTGCARLLRAYAQPSLENVALWHERDISHSSVERVVFPDAFILLDYAVSRMTQLLSTLYVDEERVTANLQKAGALVYSGHVLLELVKEGCTREEAYAWVQDCALRALKKMEKTKGSAPGFLQNLLAHPEISKRISAKRIQEMGSLKYQLRHVESIYQKALSKKAGRR